MKKEYIAPDAEVIVFSTKSKIMIDPGEEYKEVDPPVDGTADFVSGF